MTAAELARACSCLLHRHRAIASLWHAALIRIIPDEEAEANLHQRLVTLTRQAISLLCREPLPRDEIRALGAALAHRCSRKPAVLGATQEVLLSTLTESLRQDQADILRPRLAPFLGELAAGFSRQASALAVKEKTAHSTFVADTQKSFGNTDFLRSLPATQALRTLLEAAPVAVVITDHDGHIVLVNRRSEEIFGYPREEMLGKTVEFLLPAHLRHRHVAHRTRYLSDLRTRSMGPDRNLTARHKDGTEFPVDVGLSAIRTQRGILVMSFITDITARQQAEEQIRLSLREKEMLLQEIHHRVKNNLQIISSLLDLQSGNSEDPRVRRMFRESRDRVRSMALVHDQLHRSQKHARVDFDLYLRHLSTHLFRSHGVSQNAIGLTIDVPEARMEIDTAVACGLIVNELVSNSLKHAFPTKREADEIHITLGPHGDDYLALTVADNGVGLPSSFDIRHNGSLGLRLVRTLADQLEGHIEVQNRSGTAFSVVFPASGQTEIRESR